MITKLMMITPQLLIFEEIKDKDGNYFDLRQKVIINTEPYYYGLYDDNDLVSKKYVDLENS